MQTKQLQTTIKVRPKLKEALKALAAVDNRPMTMTLQSMIEDKAKALGVAKDINNILHRL